MRQRAADTHLEDDAEPFLNADLRDASAHQARANNRERVVLVRWLAKAAESTCAVAAPSPGTARGENMLLDDARAQTAISTENAGQWPRGHPPPRGGAHRFFLSAVCAKKMETRAWLWGVRPRRPNSCASLRRPFSMPFSKPSLTALRIAYGAG